MNALVGWIDRNLYFEREGARNLSLNSEIQPTGIKSKMSMKKSEDFALVTEFPSRTEKP
ncbi:hypothetical protein [Methanosarcina mazei]|uniref:hypothetical protein n=1 Tax=Methanosarcina mazei TaxID=2209 RepID=UPI000A4C0B27|nr:hypothetical protein [Methanosarcina mazei]